MPVFGIKRKGITIEIPLPAYENLQKLAGEKDVTVPGYVKQLIAQHLYENGLSQYFRPGDTEISQDK